MDGFTAREPEGGFSDVVRRVQDGEARARIGLASNHQGPASNRRHPEDTAREAVYPRKLGRRDQRMWMDGFTSLEPQGGFRDVVRLAQKR